MRQIGIQGNLLCWLNSYLCNRQQQVLVGQSRSRLNNINSGVPQGSVLGPLMFLIYVNDITENLLSITRLFADDTSLSCTATNINDLEGIISHDLNIISNWSKQWLVYFNPQKTEFLYYGHQQSPSLEFEMTMLTPSFSHKHLGVTFSNDYKWKSHINNIITSSSTLIGIMRNIEFKIRRKALNQIYISYLRPLLEYASSVWDNCNNFEKYKLEKIQLEAARIVTGSTRSTSLNNIYRETGWLTLSNRRLYQKLLIMYKIKNGMVPEYLSSLFPRTMDNPVPYNLRNNDDFITYPCRTALFENSFVPSGIKAWNNLPAQIRNSPSISCFKRRLLDSYFNSSVVPKYWHSQFIRYPYTIEK